MTVVPVKEDKDMRYQDSIVKDCITAMAEDRIPEVTVSCISMYTVILCFSLSVSN